MMNDIDVYRIYLGIKTHFMNGEYDFIEQKGRIKATNKSWNRRKDQYFFHRINKRYPRRDDVIAFFVSNLLNNTQWIGELISDEADYCYLQWRKRFESITYNFTQDMRYINDYLLENELQFNDIFVIKKHQYPIIIKMVMGEDIDLECLVLMDSCLQFMKILNKTYKGDIIWDDFYNKVIKYSKFFNVNGEKYREIMKDIFYEEKERKTLTN